MDFGQNKTQALSAEGATDAVKGPLKAQLTKYFFWWSHGMPYHGNVDSEYCDTNT